MRISRRSSATIGAAFEKTGATINVANLGYNIDTPQETLSGDAELIAGIMHSQIPSGTITRLMMLLLNREIQEYQERDDEQAAKFMAVYDVYAERLKK